MFAVLKDRHLMALYRGDWKRCKPWFRHPRQMMALRAEVERMGLK